jgi:hypothetical protein
MHFDSPGIWLDQAVQHAKQCGFTGAVMADESETFSLFELEAYVLYCPEFIRSQITLAVAAADEFIAKVLHTIPKGLSQRAAKLLGDVFDFDESFGHRG